MKYWPQIIGAVTSPLGVVALTLLVFTIIAALLMVFGQTPPWVTFGLGVAFLLCATALAISTLVMGARPRTAEALASQQVTPSPSSLKGFWVDVVARNYNPVAGAAVAFRARWNGLIATRGGGETGEGGGGQGIVGKPDDAIVTVIVTPPGGDKAIERTVAWKEGGVETIVLSDFPPAVQYHG
jgi:hypothetical protein